MITALKSPDEKSQICNTILRSLPNWFGIESAIIEYVNDVKKLRTWKIELNNEVVGFIALNEHSHYAAEIHVMGILQQHHSKGLGKQLIQEIESILFLEGFKYLTVKTLSAKRPDEYYDKTRAFYLKMGFTVLEEFKNLWSEENPCLMLIKMIQSPQNHNLDLEFPKFKFEENLHEIPLNVSDWEKFISINQESLKSENNIKAQRILCGQVGVACRVLNHLDEAEKYLHRAVSLSVVESPSIQIQSLLRLAHVYQWKNEFNFSKILFQQVRSLFNEFEVSDTLRAMYHQHLGKYYFDQNYFGLALIEFELAKKIRLKIKAPQEQIESALFSIAVTKKNWSLQTPSQLIIRRAEVTDAKGIHDAHMISINEICSKDHSADEIRVWGGRQCEQVNRLPAIKNDFYLVVESQDKVEGFCQLKLNYKDGLTTAHLYGLYITPKILKMKVGHVLMALVFEYCLSEDVKLINLGSSLTARGFYKKYGFYETGDLSFTKMNSVDVRYYPMERKFKSK